MQRMLRLATPVALMYLGLMLMGFVDLLVVGRLGAAAVGAVGVGTAMFTWIMVMGIGMLTGIDYPAAHAIGEGKPEVAYRTFVQGLYLSVFMGVPLTLFLFWLSYHLDVFGFNEEVLPFAEEYLRVISWSLLPVFGFNACRSYLQALNIAIPTLVALILGNLLNAFLNVGWVFGKWGMTKYGFVGTAYATNISRVFILVCVFWTVYEFDRRTKNYFREIGFKLQILFLRPILTLGFPSALQMLMEVGVFAMATALAAKFSAREVAAHQIVLNTASLAFMVPMGISSATAVLVGHAMGAKDYALARKAGWQGFQIGVGFMCFTAAAFLLVPDLVLSAYTNDEEVVRTAKGLLLVAALFQLSDGAQVVATGALRGIGNTKIAAWANFVGHWIVGLPLGLLLGFTYDGGVRGIWIGLSTGLTIVALIQLVAWQKRSQPELLRSENSGERSVFKT